MQGNSIANNSESAKWLTILQAAVRAGVSPDTIRRRVKSGDLRASMFAGKYRIHIDDLDETVARGAA